MKIYSVTDLYGRLHKVVKYNTNTSEAVLECIKNEMYSWHRVLFNVESKEKCTICFPVESKNE